MKLLLQFVRYIEACVTAPDWLDKFHLFFSASLHLSKESERFIFLGIFWNLFVRSFLNFQSRIGWLFCENNQNDQRQNIVSIPSMLVTPLTVVIRMKGFDKYSQTQRTEDSSPGRIQAAPLSWLNFVTSHSSWEASKIKSSKTNRWIIIVTDYQTWAGKLHFFWYIDFWISDFSSFKTELLNSLLSNINDDGDNNEKTKKIKTRMGMFKNMGANIPGGNFLGGSFPGGSLLGGNFPGWSFPNTIALR